MTKKAAVQEPTESVLYEERTSKKAYIRQRVRALKEENGAVSSDAHSKRFTAEEAAVEVSRFMKPIKEENERRGKDKNSMDPWQNEQYGKLKGAADAAEEAATSAEQRKTTIAQEINKLESELENFGFLLGVDDVLQYQEDVAKAEKKVSDFQTLIAEQEGIIENARQDAPDLLDILLRRRENILADIVMGQATENDLKALDGEIAAQDEAVIAFNKTSSQAKQIIAGLQRMLSEAEDALNILRSRREDVITEFLMGQAELLGEKYVKLSIQLVDKFKELTALDQIMGYPSRLIGTRSDGFAIPTFRLKAFDGLEQNGYYGQIHAVRTVAGAYRDNSVIDAAVTKMKAVFSEAGIRL